ncbi:MAG: hypothetical protein V4665_01650 [Patescibacteria group bacterium]
METLTRGLDNLWTADGLTDPEKNLLQKFIAEVARKAKGFISELFGFDKTRTAKSRPEEFIISKESVEEDFFQPIREREASAGNIVPWLDEDIWKFWKGKKVPGFLVDIIFSIYRFLKNLTHRQILEEGEKQEIKKIYSYAQAKEIIRTAIWAGDVDQKNTGVFAYFKVDAGGPLYRFSAFRRGGGQLRVFVDGVGLDGVWYVGLGVCFG